MAAHHTTGRGYKSEDVSGQTFNRLTVLEQFIRGKNCFVRCLCQCGKEKTTRRNLVVTGATKSCGCLARELSSVRNRTHGRRETALYAQWQEMRNRCERPKHGHYDRYGGRGIKVCERWRGKGGFINFLADMGERPPGMTLERINNDGNYEPGNVRWATRKEQARNRCDNVRIMFRGRIMILIEWAEEFGITGHQLGHLIRKHGTEKAMTVAATNTPVS